MILEFPILVNSFKCKNQRGNSKEVMYRDYKHFNGESFRDELKVAIDDTCSWTSFENQYLNVLNKHAPIKKKTSGQTMHLI